MKEEKGEHNKGIVKVPDCTGLHSLPVAIKNSASHTTSPPYICLPYHSCNSKSFFMLNQSHSHNQSVSWNDWFPEPLFVHSCKKKILTRASNFRLKHNQAPNQSHWPGRPPLSSVMYPRGCCKLNLTITVLTMLKWKIISNKGTPFEARSIYLGHHERN